MASSVQFLEYKKSSQDKNSVWHHFKRSPDGQQAQCNICKQILKILGGSKSPLHNHLHLKHSINLKEQKRRAIASTSANAPTSACGSGTSGSNVDNEIPKKKSKVTHYFQRDDDDSIEVMVSKLAALDGMAFSAICTSEVLRRLFAKSGLKLAQSPHTIKKIVITHCKELKADLKKELEKLKSEECKFSASLDEWTSAQNKRFMNVNIHSTKLKQKCFRNLGLTEITGKGTAENCFNILKDKLNEYNLSLDSDIICISSDGASVMCALGKKTSAYHQLCYAHGIQCGVLDVLYKTKKTTTSSIVVQENIDIDTDITDTTEKHGDLDSSEEEDCENEGGFIVATAGSNKEVRLMECYRDLINKVRKVVKMFKRSPTKSEILYKYDTDGENKSVHLILDCKTRWSSLANMLSRFLLLKDSILKALIDLKYNDTFSEEEWQQLHEISESLEIIKVTVESICEEKANLLTAETALQFMIQKLSQKEEQISVDLLESLKKRIAQRRVPELSGTIKYLHSPTSFYEESNTLVYPFKNPGNDLVKETIVRINSAYFDSVQETVPTNTSEMDQMEEVSTTRSVKEQLQQRIHKCLAQPQASHPSSSRELHSSRNDLETTVCVEMALFDGGGKRGQHLDRAYNALLSIPPSSVEAERVFSASGYLCNHLRTSMKEDSLDSLSFLRSYYQGFKK